ncbi:YggT family protein [Chloroflexota bacterium]
MTIFFNIVRLVCEVLTIAIFIRSVLSWFSPRPNALTILLVRITEPILTPLRRIVPQTGMFDFTPLVAIILLQLIAYLLP